VTTIDSTPTTGSSAEFAPGALVTARGRDWVVLPDSTPDFLLLRPLGGGADDVAGILVGFESVAPASFPPPSPDQLGNARSARLLRDALRIGFRSSAGPFRSLAGLSVEPRAYQLVPLLLSLRQDTVRLLIGDDVGIGKTIEAGLVAAELLAQGSAQRLSVLCSPALAEQWESELRTKFGMDPALVLPGTVTRLRRGLAMGEDFFARYPITVVSTDFIKQTHRRDEFARSAPELVIVDEAHTCVADGSGRGGTGRTLRYDLMQRLAADPNRHMILVTATPHSGVEEGFRNLLGLLDPRLASADLTHEAGRASLAEHFVQRRRKDIERYLDEETPFPRDRETREAAYTLSPAYKDLFDDVLAYARETVRDDTGGLVRQRVRWWSALALLRSLASSPAAAAETLAKRAGGAGMTGVEEADRFGRSTVMDQSDDESVESAEVLPGAVPVDESRPGDEPPPGTPEARTARRLRDFRRRALAMTGPEEDRKLALVADEVATLLREGFQPIVFCRFIPTAHYVATHLSAALPGKLKRGRALPSVVVEAVTGELPPDERIRRVEALGGAQPDAYRVLVATDCLSEGVNLQEHFQAVVHYDLAWNPTRHEQREGRVDRFGQPADVVRALTVYGTDNGIDGIVLDILLRKHDAIRKTLGVAVPVPADSDRVVEAVVEGLLLRGHSTEQEELPLGLDPAVTALHQAWDSTSEKERESRTRYRHAGIQPAEVQAELDAVRAALGTGADAERFVVDSLQAYGATITPLPRGLAATTGELPLGLRELLTGNPGTLTFCRDLPVGRGEALLRRTDPRTADVARFVLARPRERL
jgi:superfamily II DNA or RNA helicase